MAQISARTAKWAKWSVVPAALLVSGLAVSQASYSAFTSTTVNPENSWAAGTVKLDNDAATALFSAKNLKPGDGGTKCITVTSTGSLKSAVKLYATKSDTTNELSSSIDLAITEGTGTDSDCKDFTVLSPAAKVYSGTLAAFSAGNTSFATGWGSWTPTGEKTETRTFQIEYTLNSKAPDTTQGGTASVGFTWEAQNS